MAKEYGISCIARDQSTDAITSVGARAALRIAAGGVDFDESLQTFAVDDVIAMINNGDTFITITRDGWKWKRGARVEVFAENFIRTVPDASTDDNLDSLPRC